MKHIWIIVLFVFLPLTSFAQADTVRVFHRAQLPERTEVVEQSFATAQTPSLQHTPDSVVRVEVITMHHYTDTLTRIAYTPDSVARQREEVTHADPNDRRGHYVEIHAGGGYGSLGYQLSGAQNKVTGFVSAIIQAQYAYFFHPNWGIGAGLWFTNYTSFAHIGGAYKWLDQTDTDSEQHYDHTATVNRWREREIIHSAGIPLSIQFQYNQDDWKARIFAALGAAPSIAVMKHYQVVEGEITHTGYYPAWQLELKEMHEFQTKRYEQEACAQGTLSIRPQIAVFADFGALVPMTQQLDLLLGVYANYSVNDVNGSAKKALGWKDETFTFMEEYKGAYATDLASASHPWEAGVKIGIHWRYIRPDKHKTIDYFDYFMREDTTIDLLSRCDTVVTERWDTLTRVHIAKAAEEVERLNKIYFDYDSYRLSKETKDYLSSIVGILNKVPDAKIAIDGHASEEGQRLHNEQLAYNRAKAVAKYLISKGIDRHRVIVIGHGSLVPNEENVNHELPLDRRAEVKIVQKQSEIE